ncbi:MAG: hypothetical protein ACTSRG_13125 [Candidatus Helarchaeota archaeon]
MPSYFGMENPYNRVIKKYNQSCVVKPNRDRKKNKKAKLARKRNR